MELRSKQVKAEAAAAAGAKAEAARAAAEQERLRLLEAQRAAAQREDEAVARECAASFAEAAATAKLGGLDQRERTLKASEVLLCQSRSPHPTQCPSWLAYQW